MLATCKCQWWSITAELIKQGWSIGWQAGLWEPSQMLNHQSAKNRQRVLSSLSGPSDKQTETSLKGWNKHKQTEWIDSLWSGYLGWLACCLVISTLKWVDGCPAVAYRTPAAHVSMNGEVLQSLQVLCPPELLPGHREAPYRPAHWRCHGYLSGFEAGFKLRCRQQKGSTGVRHVPPSWIF